MSSQAGTLCIQIPPSTSDDVSDTDSSTTTGSTGNNSCRPRSAKSEGCDSCTSESDVLSGGDTAKQAKAYSPLRQRRASARGMPALSLPSTGGAGGKATRFDALRHAEKDGDAPRLWNTGLTHTYSNFRRLDGGSMSVAYSAERRSDSRAVVLKVYRASDSEVSKLAKSEYELLRSLSHPNIIKAIDFHELPTCTALVLENFNGLSLRRAVRDSPDGCLDGWLALRLFSQLLQAIKHLHEWRIIHRDIKPENVLVSNDLRSLKVIDFNTSCSLLEGGALTPTGTRDFLAPEILSDVPFAEPGDVWAAGFCFHFMLRGRLPQKQTNGAWAGDLGDSDALVDGERRSDNGTDPIAGCTRVLRQCLADADQRPTVARILEEVSSLLLSNDHFLGA